MVCYVVPLVAAIISSTLWGVRKQGAMGWWLNLLLYGGTIFGIVDHLWSGELFLIGQATLMDLMLGATITVAILASWGITLGIVRTCPKLAHKAGLTKK